MPLAPFDLGSLDLGEDFDDAILLLEDWLEDTLPLFHKSSEFQALSKVNRKYADAWVRHFMDMHLGYIGGNLNELGVADAREIMEGLTPRKMMTSQTQAKTIAPGITAFWKFLVRACGAQALPEGSAVAQYLKSIEKDYLHIYNQEDDYDDDFDGPGFGEPGIGEIASELALLSPQQGENFVGWVALLIQQLGEGEELPDILEANPAIEALINSPSAIEFVIQHVCLNELPADSSQAEATYNLLMSVCEAHFRLMKANDADAIELWLHIENNLQQADAHDALQPAGTGLLFVHLGSYKAFLSAGFLEFVQQWLFTKGFSGAGPDVELEDLRQVMNELLEEVDDEFSLIELLREKFDIMPEEFLIKFLPDFATLGNPMAARALFFYVLDANPSVALVAVREMAKNLTLVDSQTLTRLTQVRNWLASSVQAGVDDLISKARHAGIEAATASEGYQVQSLVMTSVDGGGRQGLFLMVKGQEGYHLAGAVMGEDLGFDQVFVSPPMTKTHVQDNIRHSREFFGAVDKVPLAFVQQLIPVCLARHKVSGAAFPLRLVQLLEILELPVWNPEFLSLEQLLPENFWQNYPLAKAAGASRRSTNWCDSAIGTGWCIERGILDKATEGGATLEQLPGFILNNFDDHVRRQWQERMFRLALWAQNTTNKNRQKQAPDFAFIGKLLAEGKELLSIGLMQRLFEKAMDEYADNAIDNYGNSLKESGDSLKESGDSLKELYTDVEI